MAFSTGRAKLTQVIPDVGFNPPCGCVAFSTPAASISVGWSWRRFNPPCGCVAFSTLKVAREREYLEMFQSALRMRGLFNAGARGASAAHERRFQSALRMRGLFNSPHPRRAERDVLVSIRLADAWPFQRGDGKGPPGGPPPGFNPPCGCVAFSTWARERPAHASRSFNPPCGCVAFSTTGGGGRSAASSAVSIRLADAWPFQPAAPSRTAW